MLKSIQNIICIRHILEPILHMSDGAKQVKRPHLRVFCHKTLYKKKERFQFSTVPKLVWQIVLREQHFNYTRPKGFLSTSVSCKPIRDRSSAMKQSPIQVLM